MTTRLSAYPEIHHRAPAKVDYYRLGDREIWIVHAEGCQRAMTADGLCTCEDPEMFEVRP